MAAMHGGAFQGQFAGDRAFLEVRTRDLASLVQKEMGERAHPDPTDPDEVDSHRNLHY